MPASSPVKSPKATKAPAAEPPLREIETHKVTVKGRNSELSFDVANDPAGKVYFALGVRKSGSTMLNRIVNVLARRNHVNIVNIPAAFFNHGMDVEDWGSADLREVVKPGNIYLGFRSFPLNISDYPEFNSSQKIFMFRDPRDALVSQYFSDAYSHPLPSRETETGKAGAEAFEKKRAEARSTDIDAYVLKHARSMDKTLLAFAKLLADPTCLLLRYEEYVFQKRRMIHKILQHFEWSCPPGQIDALLQRVDEVPEHESKERFVRRVIPGDHRAKLAPETIRKLNGLLRESMQFFDYY
jgi:hypothetical protein